VIVVVVVIASGIVLFAFPVLDTNSPYLFAAKWGSQGTGDGQFNQPLSLAIDSSSNTLYVADRSNHRVQKFDSNGNFITKWGSQGTGDGQFNQPSDITVDSSSNTVYVVELINSRVQKFQLANTCPAGTTQIVLGVCFVTKWGSQGTGDGQFNQLAGVAIDSSNNVYVADASNHRVQKFDSNGNFITKWGSLGTGDGQFNKPSGVAIDSSSNTVYVPDHSNHRIQKFVPPHRTIFDILVSRIR
jgi:tripartite motif-containing protein 71